MSRTRFASGSGTRVAYELRGFALPGRPVLALIQGVGFGRTGWGPAIRSLRRSFRLVLIDNRGSGRSAAVPGSLTVPDMCRDVVAVLDDAKIATAHVLGASLGGMVAQDLALRHPDRVERLVLACTTPGWPFAYPMPAAFVQVLAASRRLTADVARRRLVEASLAGGTAAARPELVDRILAHWQPAADDQATWQAQAVAGARYRNLRQFQITARTLVLHGAADIVVDPRNARLLARRIPGAELSILPGVGHLMFWENPEGFAAAVTSFLLDRSPRAGVA